MRTLRDGATIGEAYGPAMAITDAAEAAEYFTMLVDYSMRHLGIPKEEAENMERANLRFYAGHCSDETYRRVVAAFGL